MHSVLVLYGISVLLQTVVSGLNRNKGIRMSKIIKEAQKHLQQKREKYRRQEEKMEEMKCTMQHTEKEIKQLEYALEVMESAEKAGPQAESDRS